MGIAPLHFGIDVSQAAKALGSSFEVEHGPYGCSLWLLPGLPSTGVRVIAFHGRLGYIQLSNASLATTGGIRVGDSLGKLRHRYAGKLRHGRSASLSGAELRLFSDLHRGGAVYTLEFEIVNRHVRFIDAGTRHTIESFGECA